MKDLSNLHEIMQDAALETEKDSKAMVPVTLKIYEDEKDIAKNICEMNGTTISAFLRNCLKQLIKEYRP